MHARIYRKSLGNQLSIAIGSGASSPKYGIPQIAQRIKDELKLSMSISHPSEYFKRWNELVKSALNKCSVEDLLHIVTEVIHNVHPTSLHRSIASIPISNFIDTTFDRSLLKALIDEGKTPILNDWHSQMMGSWRQSNAEQPNIFFMLPPITGQLSLYGIYEPSGLNTQNQIQIENMREMLNEKDLLLVGLPPDEAEFILHLHNLCLSYEKAYACIDDITEARYWAQHGVMIQIENVKKIVERLVPSEGAKYSILDGLIPSRKLVEVTREKQYDAFISYFSGDRPFVLKLAQDLKLRGVHIWRDEREIDVGDSMSEKIENGLTDSYAFIIVLSPEAIVRPWVKEELRAAYAQRLAGNFKILPVLHRECDIPPLLVDYKYADFRDDRRYEEQLGILERAIRNAVRSAREKK